MFGTVISFRSEEDMRLLERSVKVLKSAAKFSQVRKTTSRYFP